MSHFAVLVVGEDIVHELAPFHEFECTGHEDEFVQEVDVSDDVRNWLVEQGGSLGADCIGDASGAATNRIFATDPDRLASAVEDVLGTAAVSNASQVDVSGDHKYGYAIVAGGALLKAVRRTNPNRRWDWYVLGGRWTGALKLKPGAKGSVGKPGVMTEPGPAGWVDQARKRDIDFEGMRDAAEETAREEYRKFYATLDGLPLPPRWNTVLEQHQGNVEAARETYSANPSVVRLRGADQIPLWDEVNDTYGCTEAEFVRRARNSACVYFAYVKNREWFERGRMHMFAMVDGEMDRETWAQQFNDMIDALPDDALLSIVDCHI